MIGHQEYPTYSGEKLRELPHRDIKVDGTYILLPDYKLYKKISRSIFCQKCKSHHSVRDWSLQTIQGPFIFIDILTNKALVINSQTPVPCESPPSPPIPPKTLKSVATPLFKDSTEAYLTASKIGEVDTRTSTLNYTITVVNTSLNIAKNVCITDLLPDVGSIWTVIAPKDKCELNGSQVKCYAGDLPPGQSFIMKVSSKILYLDKRTRTIFNSAQITANNTTTIEVQSTTTIPGHS